MSVPKTHFEASLNVLREELRAVTAARRAILSDRDLAAEDGVHHQQLLKQTMAEMAQHARAISLLERVAAGELVEMALPDPVPPPAFVQAARPVRQTALVRRTPDAVAVARRAPIGGWA
jgi:hypothetical protein